MQEKTHESHVNRIIRILGSDKWVCRDELQAGTQSKNLTARITQARGEIPKGMVIICLKQRGKLRIVSDTFYACIARELLDKSHKTTYELWNLPKAVSELLGEPKKKRFLKYYLS